MKRNFLTEHCRRLIKRMFGMHEADRLRYMLEWREKAIGRYVKALEGYDEEIRILGAYLVYLADKTVGENELRIPKDAITSAIKGKHPVFRDGGDSYILTLVDDNNPTETEK